ncbi:MAG: histidinol dehydrogenase [Actinomycetota bacterium]
MLPLTDRRGGRGARRPRELGLGADVVEGARAICERVRTGGDAALVALTRELDGADVEGRLPVSGEEMEGAIESTPADLRGALDRMADRLRDLHGRQLPRPWEAEADGVRFGEVVRPVASVGCYVPGGLAAYPSTVLMTAIPASVAGVPRIAMCTPPARDGSVPAPVLYAAGVAGVEAVYRVGGAQAIAALAYGTETVPAVAKIVGPGNVWVTAAKREVAGLVGVDALAGPTELFIVADGSADPRVVAADLVAQAEHDPLARSVLVCLDDTLPARVREALSTEVAASPRRDIVTRALEHAEAAVVADLDAAAAIVEEAAPEHLQVLIEAPRAFLERVSAFGAAFLGSSSPVSFGDYGVGSNHVLPTMGTARFASGLRAAELVRVSSFVEASADAMDALGPEVELVAAAEGLPGHARAVEVRR